MGTAHNLPIIDKTYLHRILFLAHAKGMLIASVSAQWCSFPLGEFHSTLMQEMIAVCVYHDCTDLERFVCNIDRDGTGWGEVKSLLYIGMRYTKSGYLSYYDSGAFFRGE